MKRAADLPSRALVVRAGVLVVLDDLAGVDLRRVVVEVQFGFSQSL